MAENCDHAPLSGAYHKMLAGQPYLAYDPQLVELRRAARRLTRLFNQTTEEEEPRRRELLQQLFGRLGSQFEVEPPFHCDYGRHIFADDRLYMNFGCVILDCAEVHIGREAFLAPGVHIYTAHHPIDPDERGSGLELASPVRIGNRCWIGGSAIICPGVTIGDDCVVGAGSVVTRDIPPGVVAAGNPCRVIRSVGS